MEIIDPGLAGRVSVFPKAFGRDPLALARAFDGERITKARYLSLRSGLADAGMTAAEKEGRPNSVVLGRRPDERETSPL